ncbi:MAG: aromatic-ring-hydroxylating dioxygenase subunit beta, partial [Candidatus Binataceae bacterium]
PELRREIEDFLYAEADFMDSHQYDRWFGLWDEEALYWVPCNADEIDPNTQVSLIYEHREQIEDRLSRLKGRHAHAQNPKSRLMRVISNIRIADGGAGRIAVTSQFILGEVRLDRQVIWFGRSSHLLARAADGLKMREKKVVLLNNDSPIGNLTFLI